MNNEQNVLQIVSPNVIHFDSNNPRGEKEDQLNDNIDFKRLRKSIKEVGVIVPLVVKPKNGMVNNFDLIDGERRLRASIAENIETVPIRIVDDEVDGRIVAYQIHMHRKDWSRTAEAKAIRSIICEEKKKDPLISKEKLKQKLVDFTSHTNKEIQDFLNLFEYEEEITELVINSPKEFPISYIDQIEASFISPLKNYFPDLYSKFGETKLRSIMGYKFKNRLLVKTRYLMDTFNVVFQSSENKKEIEQILDSFLMNSKKDIARSFEEFKKIGNQKKVLSATKIDESKTQHNEIEDHSKSVKKETVLETKKTVIDQKSKNSIDKSKKNKINGLANIDDRLMTNQQYLPIELEMQNQTSIIDIKKKYESIGRSFSGEELEYIKEAIKCLHDNCLKAAVLMIWSATISRILDFVDKDLLKFNQCSTQMKSKKTSFYKHWSHNFQDSVTNIEEIREASRDMQLLCYICYCGIINKTQFDKLKGHYTTRNNCAHPTDLKLLANEVVSIFEIVFECVFNNQQLK